jgi:carbamoyltransferase
LAVVLGLTTYHPGSSAALLVDGRPVAAVAEERLNRIKYYAGFPAESVRTCLRMAGLELTDVDVVAVGRDRRANLPQKLAFTARHPARLRNLLGMRRSTRSIGDLRGLIAAECGVDTASLRFSEQHVEHHVAHVASAYFASPWERAAGLSIDGSGDFVTCMLTRCEGDRIEVLRRIFVPHSLGTFYATLCELIGYPNYGDEGKVMGLAPYGTDTLVEQVRDLVRPTREGFELNEHYYRPFGSESEAIHITETGSVVPRRHYTSALTERFGPAREPEHELTQRDKDIAFAAQRVFETQYLELTRRVADLVGGPRLALAGGCALNSVANGMIFAETPFDETWIQPAAGDEGLALGAALHVSNAVLHEGRRFEMTDAYLGPSSSDAEVEAALEQAQVRGVRLDRASLVERTAERIAAGDVVGWFQGRMEWGPRALGNRSILVHPGLPGMKDVLNERIKRREWFRPFAPAVLAERQAEIFERSEPSPFMLHVYEIRPEWRERLSAVTHVDGTGRLQTVARSSNPLYYDLISAFEGRTGIPVLLNTSFNENEPIVCTPAEAIECFLRTRMDVLVCGSFFCTKTGPQ